MDLTANLHLLWPEFLLAGLAFFVLTADLFLPSERKNKTLSAISSIGLVGLIAFTLIFFSDKEATPLYGGIIQVDRFALFFKIVFLGFGVLAILASGDYVKRHLTHPGEYYAILLFSILGMMLMAGSFELLTAYIGLELLSFSLYVLVSFGRDSDRSTEAGTKYIILGAFASALLLYGISLVYGVVAQSDVSGIPTSFAAVHNYILFREAIPPTLTIGIVLIVVGLGFKVAAVPFHMWAPDVYEGAPLPITAYLAVASKAATFALILRLFSSAFMPAKDEWELIFALLAAVTMTVGNLAALAQHNIKRLLAYSSVGQVGYLLVGVASLSWSSSNAIMLHLVGYGVTTMSAFVAVIAFYNATGKEEIKDFAGLADRNPLVAMALTVSMFSLAGLPIFAGFITKFYLFAAAAEAGMLWLAGLAIFNSFISLYYYLVVIRQMYIEPPEDSGPVSLSWVTGSLLSILVGATVLIGIYPKPLVDVIQTATTALRL
jgi:NADH-quinone oxidoreductase subunit N